MSQARQRIEELEDLLKMQQEDFAHTVDAAWDTDAMLKRSAP
jgi:DNA-binding XRE family transcriptional regulator